MKIVRNKCFGGFGLSPKAYNRYAQLKGKKAYFFDYDYKNEKYIPITLEEAEKKTMLFVYSVSNPTEANKRAKEICIDPENNRTDPDLVKVVEELGEAANDRFSNLEVVEIPDGTEWEIDNYDGIETIREKHRSW